MMTCKKEKDVIKAYFLLKNDYKIIRQVENKIFCNGGMFDYWVVNDDNVPIWIEFKNRPSHTKKYFDSEDKVVSLLRDKQKLFLKDLKDTNHSYLIVVGIKDDILEFGYVVNKAK